MPPKRRSQTANEEPQSKRRVKEEKSAPIKAEEANEILDETSQDMDFERVRQENIRRNKDFLSALGLDADVQVIRTMNESSHATKRGTTSKAKKAETVLAMPTRRSGRVTIERLRAEINTLKSAKVPDLDLIAVKETELNDMIEKKAEATFDSNYTAEVEEYKRIDNAEISLSNPLNFDIPESETADLLISKAFREEQKALSGKQTSVTYQDYITQIGRMNIKEENVAKLTEARITSVYLHPSPHKIIAMAGDKLGTIGLWDVSASGKSENDGIYRYKVHVKNVASIHSWLHDPSKVYSVSYDSTIRYLDLEKDAFSLCFTGKEDLGDIIYSDACYRESDSNSILVGRSDGFISMIDFRQNNDYRWTYAVQEGSKINSVQFHPRNEHYVVCGGSGKNGSITIHDIRTVGSNKWKPLIDLNLHDKSINAALMTPDGEYLVSVSLDNTIKITSDVLNTKETKTTISLKHDNQTGRWLSTFKPCFDMKQPSCFLMGSMEQPRRLEVFHIDKSSRSSSSSGFHVSIASNMFHELLGSVCSRNACHRSLDVIVGGNSSGRVHIFQ